MFATYHNLAKMVTQGKLRQDLFYRINGMGIDAPPLQDDPGDIPVIASHFLHRYSEEYGKLVGDFDPGAIALLKTYSWLGNLCELENVVQRAIIIAQGTCIRSEDLPRHIQDEGVANIAEYQFGGSFERQLRDYKTKLAETALKENKGNKTLAARSLQISRAYLHRLIRTAESVPGVDLGRQISKQTEDTPLVDMVQRV